MKKFAVLAVVLLALVTVHDVRATPREAYGARAAVFAIDQYRAFVSPHLRGRVRCRFEPTCSAYGRTAIRKYGLARGTFKAAIRIARCGPWTKEGTVDTP